MRKGGLMVELSDADIIRIGKLLEKQFYGTIHLRDRVIIAETTIYILLFCIFTLVITIIWGPK